MLNWKDLIIFHDYTFLCWRDMTCAATQRRHLSLLGQRLQSSPGRFGTNIAQQSVCFCLQHTANLRLCSFFLALGWSIRVSWCHSHAVPRTFGTAFLPGSGGRVSVRQRLRRWAEAAAARDPGRAAGRAPAPWRRRSRTTTGRWTCSAMRTPPRSRSSKRQAPPPAQLRCFESGRDS